jgi:hypothetical protein
MRKRSRKKPRAKDINQLAYETVQKATAEKEPAPSEISRIMAAMGRKGGRIGGKRRLETMSPEERREAAFRAAKARWDKAKKK